MKENFEYLFQYLEKESISIDKTEFLFQVQSHPDYPTLLSISDTLNFFNIENGVLKIDFDSLDLLPDRFVTFLDDSSQLYLVQRNHDNKYNFFDAKGIKNVDLLELKSKWREIVFLVEKPEVENIVNNSNKEVFLLPALCGMLFLAILVLLQVDIKTYLFFIFPIVGILFSIASLKDIFGAKSELINNFCNISSSTSCSEVLGSKRWRLFKYVNLADLSFVFFVFQFAILSLSLILNSTIEFFQIQKILLIFAMPVILLSIYYQKQVEKKWCPICLTISLDLVASLVFIYLFFDEERKISINYILLSCLTLLLISYSWYVCRNLLIKIKELKEFQIKANRFMRNYNVFRDSLTSKPKVELINSPITLGNENCKTEITIITSPFCGHCKTAHHILDKIYDSNKEHLKINIIINTDIDDQTDQTKTFFRSLQAIYLQRGETEFMHALNNWFNNQNLELWLEKYQMKYNPEQMDYLYRISNIWCEENRFTFTPAIFINGYQYPKTHYRENLKFFINDLIEDDM